jgi:hypothetical protein
VKAIGGAIRIKYQRDIAPMTLPPILREDTQGLFRRIGAAIWPNTLFFRNGPAPDSGITTIRPVRFILDGLLEVATHATRVDSAVIIPAEHAVAFKLHKQRRALLLGYASEACELLLIDPPTVDEQRPIALSVVHDAHHLSP